MPSIWLLIDLYCYQVNGLQLSGIYTLQHFEKIYHLLIYGSHYRGMVIGRIDRTIECNGSATDSWMDGCVSIENRLPNIAKLLLISVA